MESYGAPIPNHDFLTSATDLIDKLQGELVYYQSLLLTDLNPSSISILNALRLAVDIREELEKLKNAESLSTLLKLCESLEMENAELKRIIAER